MADDLIQPDERAQIVADLRHHWPTQIECRAAADQIEADADALARKNAEIAALKLERDDYANACKHSADDLRARDAEIAALQKERAELREQRDEALRARERAYDNRDMALRSMEAAESQLAALRERIEKAPVVQVEPAYTASMHGMGGIHCATINVIGEDAIAIGGKRVALVAREE